MENLVNRKCFVTYTISYCVEVELDIPSDIEIDVQGEINNETEIFRINQANLEVIDSIEGGEYVDGSFEVTNIMVSQDSVPKEISEKTLYNFGEITEIVKDFINRYGWVAERQGWCIAQSDSERHNDKYVSTRPWTYYEVEKLDDFDILESDQDAYKLAESFGLIINENGLVLGFKILK